MPEPKLDNTVKDACKALGIKARARCASRVYEDGRTVIVTVDGRKLSWRKGDKGGKPDATGDTEEK